MKEKIEIDRAALAANIKSFVESQKTLWEQVPYWALQADGKSGFSDRYRTAYTSKVWIVFKSDISGVFTLAVDCVTGKLITPFSIGEQIHQQPMDNDIIIAKLDHLDAMLIIKELKYSADREDLPGRDYGIGYQSGNHWREIMMKKNRIVDLRVIV